jgi:hypothetical protein
MHMTIVRQRPGKHSPGVVLSMIERYPLPGNGPINTHSKTTDEKYFLCGPCRGIIRAPWCIYYITLELTRVEAGLNSSTVNLRVVGGDENGSLKSETAKYGRESQGTRTRGRLRCQGPSAYKKTDPSSRQRGPPQKQDRNCQTVMSPTWGSTPRLTDWLTDRQSQCDFDFDILHWMDGMSPLSIVWISGCIFR